jgi:hypothetical protein
MRDEENDNIFDKDDALDFIIYKDLGWQDRGNEGRNGGCLGIIVLLLLPLASVMLLCWKC